MSKETERKEKKLLESYNEDVERLEMWIKRNEEKIQQYKEEIEDMLTENKAFVQQKAAILEKLPRVQDAIK